MEIGTLRLRLNKVGSDVPVTNATPAEAVLLHLLHQGNNGGSTFGEDMDKITVTGVAKDGDKVRSDVDELKRLKAKYGHCVNKKGDKIVGLVWAGLNVKLPQTFKELVWADVSYDGVEVAPLNLATGTPVVAAPVPSAK
jgi:hypothetical protein